MLVSAILPLAAIFAPGELGHTQAPRSDIRSIDFKNFTYPWSEPDQWPDHLQWMSLKLKEQIHLSTGKWNGRDADDDADDKEGQFSGLTLEGVDYANVSSSAKQDAIVVLRYDTGGTQYHYWVYIYTLSNGVPKLLGFFHAGDRAAHGLYRVFAKDRALNVDLFDPDSQEGDCCSSGYIRYQFKWNGAGFQPIGKPTKAKAESNSRRAVSVFGLPLEPQ